MFSFLILHEYSCKTTDNIAASRRLFVKHCFSITHTKHFNQTALSYKTVSTRLGLFYSFLPFFWYNKLIGVVICLISRSFYILVDVDLQNDLTGQVILLSFIYFFKVTSFHIARGQLQYYLSLQICIGSNQPFKYDKTPNIRTMYGASINCCLRF